MCENAEGVRYSKVMVKKGYPAIILIDKCASEFLSHELSGVGFQTEHNLNESDTAVVFLRNPNKRYLSAMITLTYIFHKVLGCHELAFNNIERSLQEDRFILGDHTCPQHIFVDVLDPNVKFLTTDKNIQRQLKEECKINITNNIPVHTKKDYPEYIQKFCKEMFEKYCNNNSIFNKLYEKDWKLYRSVCSD